MAGCLSGTHVYKYISFRPLLCSGGSKVNPFCALVESSHIMAAQAMIYHKFLFSTVHTKYWALVKNKDLFEE